MLLTDKYADKIYGIITCYDVGRRIEGDANNRLFF